MFTILFLYQSITIANITLWKLSKKNILQALQPMANNLLFPKVMKFQTKNESITNRN